MTETAVADTKDTVYQTDPSKEVVVIDPYKPEELNALAAPEESTEEVNSNVDAKLPAEKQEEIKNDPALLKRLDEKGQTLEQYITEVDKEIPRNVKLAEILKKVDILSIERDAPRINELMDARTLEKQKPSFFQTTLGYMSKAGKVVDLDKYDAERKQANALGINFKDEVTTSSIGLSLMDSALDVAGNSDLYKYVTDLGLSDKFNEWATEEGIELAAKRGSHRTVIELLQRYTGIIDNNLRYKCVGWILDNYKIHPDDIIDGFFTAANEMADNLNTIYKDWLYTTRQGDTINDHTLWLVASRDAMTMLQYSEDTAIPATLQLNNRYTKLPYDTVAPQLYQAIYKKGELPNG